VDRLSQEGQKGRSFNF